VIAFFDDLQAEWLIHLARTRDRAPLIEHLRDGGTVTQTMAAFLADVLAGTVKKPRKRPPAKRSPHKAPTALIQGIFRAYKEMIKQARKGELDPDVHAWLLEELERADHHGGLVGEIAEAAEALTRYYFRAFKLNESAINERIYPRAARRKVKKLR
jgi:hypothetical protein